MTTVILKEKRCKNLLRSIFLLSTLLFATLPGMAQNYYYVFKYSDYYLYNNGGTPAAHTDFTKSNIWIANNTLDNNNNRTLQSYTQQNNNGYLRGAYNVDFEIGTSHSIWRQNNSGALYAYGNRNNRLRYVRYNDGVVFDNTNNNNFIATRIYIGTKNASNPTASIDVTAGLTGGGIKLVPHVEGQYNLAYDSTIYNETTYYWTSSTEATETHPELITDWSDATLTWTVTTGGTYASINSDGLLTITANPTGNIVVRLGVSKGGYTNNNAATFTLTRGTAAQATNTVSTINSFSVSPSSAALYVSESQAFTASATVNITTYTTPAHTTLTGGGNTYRYYNGTLYTNTEDFSSSNSTTATPTYAWSMTGAGSGNASLSATSGASTTVTHTPGVDADKALTLTVEASYTGATPQTRSVQVNLYAPFVAPTITRSGNNISLSIASLGATIYYTTDGSTPSPSNGTVYTGPFSLEELSLPVTVKAIAVRGLESTPIAQQTYNTLSLEKPVISITSTGAVTITCASAGATIRYTTDGTNPTSSSGTVYSGSFNVANLTTVKAIAYKAGYDDSEVASETYITSGISDGVVILNDYEPHSWSYYSDASTPEQLHSLNPADVKITYYGNGIVMTGSADYTASSTDFVQPGNANYVGSAKVNVGGEDENTFVYYKTLERENADGSGRCPYTPIYNPFQVRPKYGERTVDANDFTGWRGFQCWRLKSVSGGSVYSVASGGTALTTGAVINVETPIYLAPTAEYGMEVELEAVWAIAYVKKANGNAENAVGTNNVGYERNFCVPTTGAGYTLYTGTGKRITNDNHIPVTISCYYPDGTAPDNTNNSISNTAFALTADTKFENIPINLTSNTLTLANYDIIIGRGCGTSTINRLQGINGGATDLDYSIRVESGTFNQFCFVRDGTNTTVSGRYLIKAIMGSDYDRATGTNNKLIVSPNSTFFLARTVGFTGSSNKDQKTFDCVFKSGTYQSEYWNGTDQSGQEAYLRIAYLGQNSAQGNTYPGVRCVTVEGGDFGGMCGGRGVSNNSNNSTYVNPEVIASDFRIKGGTFHGAVFGGAADNPSIGSRRFIITGGTIQSWLAGGCNGTGSQSGTGATDGDSYIYVGGTALVGGDNPIVINETNAGQVFGAGRGISGRASSVNHSHVVVADEAVVRNGNNNNGNVYGGSYNGTIADVSNVYITGGTVEGKVFGGSYGNSNSGAIPAANIIMTGGYVTNGVYGGSNSNGTISGNVTMHIDGGTVGNSETGDGVFGGGYGASTSVGGNVSVTLGASTSATDSATVYGNVYGGSALGDVNTNGNNNTTVTMNKALINGNLFGGAYGNGADVNGHITVNVLGGRVNGSVFGGGDAAAYGTAGWNFPVVNMSGGQATNVFGGGKGNTATVTGNPQVTLSGNAHVTDNVYGGGDAAQVTGNSSVTIQN